MGKPSSPSPSSTVVTQSQPPQQFLNAYSQVQNRAQNVAGQPLQQYSGSLLAGFTPMQQQAFGEIAGAQGLAQPYISQAANYLQNAGQPITITPFSGSQVNEYQSPYTQDVTTGLTNLFNQQNAAQQQQVTGNLAAQGAYGGDRTAVAQALTAGQQQLSEAPTLASTLQQGYNTSLGEFNAQQQAALQAQEGTGWLQQGAGYGLANLGQEALSSALTGAQAELGAGGQQQSLAQQALTLPYEQFTQQQAYPFQTTGWLGQLAEGLGGASGGTSSTGYPGPSIGSELLGGGLAGAGLLDMTGAFGSNGYLSGLLGAGAAGDAGAGLVASMPGAEAIGSAAAFLPAGFKRGGRIGRQDGGATGLSTTASETGRAMPPDVSVSVVPNAPSPTRGMGIPNPPQDPTLAANQNLSPMQIMQMLSAMKGIQGLSAAPPAAASARGGRAVGGPAPLHFPSTLPTRSLSDSPEFNYAPAYSQTGQPIGMKMVGPNYSVPPLTLPIGPGGAIQRGDVTGGGRGTPVDMNDAYRTPGLGEQAPAPRPTAFQPNRYPNSVFGWAAPQIPSETPTVGVPAPLASLMGNYGLPTAARGGRATSFGGSVGFETQPGEGFQAGGSPGSLGASLQAAGQSAFGGANPMTSGLLQQYLGMPTEQLQELAMRVPPNSPYGAIIQRALQQKHMNPGLGAAPTGNAPIAPSAQAPVGGLSAPPPPSPQPIATVPPPMLGQPQQQQWKGGRTGYQGGGEIAIPPWSVDEAGNVSMGDETTMPPRQAAPMPAPQQPNPDIPPFSVSSAQGLTAPPPHQPGPGLGDETSAIASPPPSSQAAATLAAPAPQQHGMPWDEAKQIIIPSESGGRNVPNYRYDPTHTAGGYFQITDTNWRNYAPRAGVDLAQFPDALSAPYDAQDRVGGMMYAEQGFKPWAPYNPTLAREVGWKGPVAGSGGAGLGQQPPGADGGDPVVQPGQGGIGSASAGFDYNSLMKELRSDLAEGKANQGSAFYNSPGMALLATGAGMMASRSPFPGVAIGEGLETGLKSLQQQQAQIPENQLRQTQAEAQRIGLEMMPAKMALAAQMAGGAPESTPPNQNLGEAAAAVTLGKPSKTVSGVEPIPVTTQEPTASPITGLPLPPGYGASTSGANAAYDRQYSQIDRQISNVRQAAIFEPDKLAEQQATIAKLMDSRAQLMSQDPRMAGARSEAEAAAQYPYRVRENLAYRAGMPVAIKPGETVITGSQLMGNAFGLPGEVGPAAGESEQPSGAGTVQSLMPVAPTPPFASPGNLQRDPTLSQPTVRLVPAPGGGMTAAPTLPGLPELQRGTGQLAEAAQKSIPVLAQAEAGLDAQHQEIISAAADQNFYTPGAFSAARQQVGTVINTIADLTGNPDMKIDPQHLGEATAIDKAAFGLSTQAVHGISSRPAQIEWSAARNAVPSNALPAFSALLLSNTLRLQNQYQKGQAQYELQQYKNGADPSEAAATWQATNGDRVPGAALAQTYIDLSKARPNDPASQWVNRLLSVPADQRHVAIQQFDARFTPLKGIDSAVFKVPSWGAMITQLGAQ